MEGSMTLDWEKQCFVDGAPGMNPPKRVDIGYNSPLAVVTGGSGNLGPVWMDTLKGMGYRIFNIDLPQYDVTMMESEHPPFGMAKAANRCIAVHGVPAVIVLNAAIDNPPGTGASFHGNAEAIITVNLVGAMNTVKAFLPYLLEREAPCTIIGISSIQAHAGANWRNYPEGFEKPCAYGASKAGLEQYARSLTVQYGRYGIRACCIGFGCYDTGTHDPGFLSKYLYNVPMGRLVSEESARAALRFAVECPEFAGQTALIDGGYLSW
jgi:NAD(P)-dependent dehydrogenase (short-subunit alcohol dehydrogenase family)